MAEQRAHALGSYLVLVCVYLLGISGEIWRGLEHPRDPAKEPFPSIFASQAADLLRKHGMHDVIFDQCRFGAVARKPTQMLINQDDHDAKLAALCIHDWHRPHIGIDPSGRFYTTPLARYPPKLCKTLAELAFEYRSGLRNHFKRVDHWEAEFKAAAFPVEHLTTPYTEALLGRSHRLQG